jgi:hypothetical protein
MLLRNRSTARHRTNPLRGGLRAGIGGGRGRAGFERLEVRQMLASAAWIGGASGYWDVAANWTGDAVPGSATAVSIAASGVAVTIRSGDTASAGSLAVAAGDALAITGGSLTTAAGLTNGGTLTVGPGGTVTIGAALVQSSTGTLDVQLGGAPATGRFGLVDAAGTATLAGTLRSEIVNGYSPSTIDTFTPVEFASASGGFASEALPSGTDYQFHAAVTFTNIVLSAAPTTPLSATVNASTDLHAVPTNLLGVNLAYWDQDAVTAQTEQAATAAGLNIYRFPGGSASDDFHFNTATNWGDSGAITIPQFAQFIASAGGTGLVTLDYGSASPQEAAAELAYLDGSPSDTTVIGSGIQWNDAAGQWQTVSWGTVGSWAALRGAAPLAKDDGLNFLRIAHSAPFTAVKDWEVGNEEYGSWEIDHHGTAGPGGVSTGAAHDPATYAAFAQKFAALAAEIQAAAGLPPISIGIDSGDPTGASDGNWTKNVLADGLGLGFVPGFISDHSYMQAPGAESDSFLLDDTVAESGSVLDWSTRYADYQTVLLQTLAGQASSVAVMATEYNSVYENPGKQSTSLVNGLFVAESLGSLLESGYSGGLVWDLRNGWDPTQNNSNLLYGWREGGDYGQLGDPNQSSPPATGPYVAYPGYYALQLASKIVASGGQVVPAASNYGDLEVYAVRQSSGDLDLLVINVNPAAAATEQFDLTGFQPGGAVQVWQYGPAQDTAQSQSPSGASALAFSAGSVSLSGSDFSDSFPAYSMTVLELSPAAAPSLAPTTPGLFNPAASIFYLKDSFSSGAADTSVAYGPAPSTWTALVGDWTGNGLTTLGLYNPATGTFFLKNTNSSGPADLTFNYGPGIASWLPIAGDWDGNGTTTVGLYNPATGTFYLKNGNSGGPADLTFNYGPGGQGWLPIAGDWDGNGTTTVGLYDPATGTFFLKNSNSSGPADLTFNYGPGQQNPQSQWKPLAGVWNGSSTTVGLYAPASGTFYLKDTNSAGPADLTFIYGPGGLGWTPLVGSWVAAQGASLQAARDSGTAPRPAQADATGLTAAVMEPILQQVIGADGTGYAGVVYQDLPQPWQSPWRPAPAPTANTPVAGGGLPAGQPGQAGLGDDQDSLVDTSDAPASALDPRAVDQLDLLTLVQQELEHVAVR